MGRRHRNIKRFLIMLIIALSILKVESGITGQSQSRRIISVKDKNISEPHFFDISGDTFDKGKVDFNKGWIGVFMENKSGEGILVKMAVKGSPADMSGMQSGDIITEINGTEVKGEDDSNLVRFKKIVEDTGKDNTVNLRIIRDGREIEIKPKLFGKLLESASGYDKANEEKYTPFYINKLKGRNLSDDESLLKFIFRDEEFQNKCSETLQRIGEEIFVREGYQKNNETNIFRLPLIDYLMTRPFDVPDAATILHDEIVDEDISKAVTAAIDLLGLNTVQTMNRSYLNKNSSAQELIESILRNIHNCAKLRKEALEDLTGDESRFIHDNSPDVWLNSDGIETDTLARFLDIAAKIDMSKLMEGLRSVVDSMPIKLLQEIKPETLELRPFNLTDSEELTDNKAAKSEALKSAALEGHISGFGGDVLFVQETDIGKIVVGGAGTTFYYDDAAIIIDIGGDDCYFNNAGASRLENPIAICLDFAGNDVYNAKKPFSQGCARLGAGILIDLNGDDRYIGDDYSQGFGMFGIGLLYDANGDDLFNARSMCQGGGAFGIGLLYDKDGNDQYLSRRFSQGLGLTKGVGGIIDMAGNDHYFAGGKYPDFRDPDRSFQSFSQGFGLGIRPDETIIGASGGIGLLFDEKGNDAYNGDYFCQGSSYYFSFGILYDKEGHDRYYSGRYSQGAGTHSTIGVLKDDEGDDFYSAYFGVAQGCGYDTAIGYMVDLKGSDYYESNVMSQGTGGEKGLGVLVDFTGDDYYYSKGESQGYSYPSKNEAFFGIGILGDVGGNADIFSIETEDNTLNYNANAGILLNKGN